MSSAAPSVAFPRVDAKKHRVEGLINKIVRWRDLSLRFVIMMNKMTKVGRLLSNVTDRCVRLNLKG